MANLTCPSCTVCLKPMNATSNGVWQHNNPVNYSFPLLVIQIALVLAVTRTLAFCFKPLRQPRVIGEIIGGILLGPTALGRNTVYMTKIFPKQSITVLDTFANVGLLFFLFMVGLELDLRTLKKVGKQALSIAAAGMILPFAAGAGVSILIRDTISKGVSFTPFLVFMGVAMSITAFPVLARILAERKLLTTDVGQMAMSAAAVNDVTAWILLALAIALSGTGTSGTVAIWVLLCGLAFVIVMFVVVKPVMTWVAHQSLDNEPIKEIYVAITLALVMISGFTTDAIGIHPIFGGFVLGLIIPKDGSFATSLIEKIEDFVSVLFLPLYFVSSGLKTNIASIHGGTSWGILVLVIVVACFGKVVGTVIVSQLYSNNLRKSITLGVLMNTKGLVELIVLNIGKDRGVLNEQVFAIMVLMALFTTFITTPIVMAIYKPARNPKPYTRRQFYQDESPKEPLRILSCLHDRKNIPAMINLVETVRGQTKRTIRLYLLRLMELSERSSAIVMVHTSRRDGRPFGAGRNDGFVVGFEAFAQLSKVTVRPMTAISEFDKMHEDIRDAAEDKRASIIILPFHKQVKLDGGFEGGNSSFRTVNRKVLECSPCSVGILIDRGRWGPAQIAPGKVDHTAVMLFFGGPDDREALAFGLRMSEHPGVKLKVIRYTPDPGLNEEPEASPLSRFSVPSARSVGGVGAVSSRYFELPEIDSGLERQRDDDLLDAIRHSKDENTAEKCIFFEEVEISDLAVSVMEVCKASQCDLILVGRNRRHSPLLAALCRNREKPTYSELGTVGDVLLTPNCRSSVLVVQQYDPNLINHNPKVVDADPTIYSSDSMDHGRDPHHSPNRSIVQGNGALESPV